jgi:hypothetical protein
MNNKGKVVMPDAKFTEGDIHLINHFVRNHTDLSTLNWVILHSVGKKGADPASSLLKWEHAYISHFDCTYPNGLNCME